MNRRSTTTANAYKAHAHPFHRRHSKTVHWHDWLKVEVKGANIRRAAFMRCNPSRHTAATQPSTPSIFATPCGNILYSGLSLPSSLHAEFYVMYQALLRQAKERTAAAKERKIAYGGKTMESKFYCSSRLDYAENHSEEIELPFRPKESHGLTTKRQKIVARFGPSFTLNGWGSSALANMQATVLASLASGK